MPASIRSRWPLAVMPRLAPVGIVIKPLNEVRLTDSSRARHPGPGQRLTERSLMWQVGIKEGFLDRRNRSAD